MIEPPPSAAELASLRDQLARETVSYCYERSAYYRAAPRRPRCRRRPRSRGVDDLERLPVLLGKDDERELQERSRAELGHPFGEHLCVEPAEVVAVASTSGTTGTPTFYAFTPEDVADDRHALGPGAGPGRHRSWERRAPGLRSVDVPSRLSAATRRRADGRTDRAGRCRGRYPAPTGRGAAGLTDRLAVHAELRPPPGRDRAGRDARTGAAHASCVPENRVPGCPRSARRSSRRPARSSTTRSAVRTAS